MSEFSLGRRSLFTIAAWLLPALGAIPVSAWVRYADAHPHGIAPGLAELVYGIVVLAVVGVVCAVFSFVRRERWRWTTTPILLAGGTIIGWFVIAALP